MKMNRDSKGRFCKEDFEELYMANIHKDLMGNCFGDQYFIPTKNESTEEGSRYTVGVKVVAFYDVDIRANSPEEAIQKISEMSSYKLLTEEIPVDSRDPVFSWLALQDE